MYGYPQLAVIGTQLGRREEVMGTLKGSFAPPLSSFVIPKASALNPTHHIAQMPVIEMWIVQELRVR